MGFNSGFKGLIAIAKGFFEKTLCFETVKYMAEREEIISH